MSESVKVHRPNYFQLDGRGRLVGLFCKACGSAIAERRGKKFERLPIYNQAVVHFKDGSTHIMNGCVNCLHEGMSRELAQAMYDADAAAQPEMYPYPRVVTSVEEFEE